MDNLRKTLGCLLLFLFAAVTSTYAQVAKQYSGTVTDADSNEPVIGVNVTLKDAQTGTVTDLSGKFSISAPVGSTLLFSPFVIRFQLLQEIPQYMCCHKDTSFLRYFEPFIISMFLIQTSWLVFQLLLPPNEKRQNGCHFQGYKFFS